MEWGARVLLFVLTIGNPECPECARAVKAEWGRCQHCGAKLDHLGDNRRSERDTHHPLLGTERCPECNLTVDPEADCCANCGQPIPDSP